MKKKIPAFKTDEEAEWFVATAHLSQYDLAGFTPTQFEFQAKAAQLNMRVPKPLLDAGKERTRQQRTLHALHPAIHGTGCFPAEEAVSVFRLPQHVAPDQPLK